MCNFETIYFTIEPSENRVYSGRSGNRDVSGESVARLKSAISAATGAKCAAIVVSVAPAAQSSRRVCNCNAVDCFNAVAVCMSRS